MSEREVQEAEQLLEEAEERVDDAYRGWWEAQQAELRAFLNEQAGITVREQADVTARIDDLAPLKQSVTEAIEACVVKFAETYALPIDTHATKFVGTNLDEVLTKDTPDIVEAFGEVLLAAGYSSGSSSFAERPSWQFYNGRYRSGQLPLPAPQAKAFASAIGEWAGASRNLSAARLRQEKETASSRWDEA